MKTFMTTIILILLLIVLSNFQSEDKLDNSDAIYSNDKYTVDKFENEKYESEVSKEENNDITQADTYNDESDYEYSNTDSTDSDYKYTDTDSSSSDYKNNDTDYEYSDTYSNDSDYEESSVAHIGKTAYISKANSYYHAISNCKYLEGASTTSVTVSSDIGKYECNCWYNPVEYVPPVKESVSEGSSGTYVYISSGNSYYHKSSGCKFLNGASSQKVDLSSVSSKYPCNCMKY